MNRTIYYIDSIYQPALEPNISYVVLNNYGEDTYESVQVPTERITRNNEQIVFEGNFVYYDKENQLFESANDTDLARRAYGFANSFIEQHTGDELIDVIDPGKYSYKEVKSIRSYHVNVGHGNCSFIVIKRNDDSYEIWMVDCSTIDFLKLSLTKNIVSNVESTITGIYRHLKIKKKDFHIDRFILTHKHYDHFNGLIYLLNHKYIDGRTIIYSNLYYINAGSTFQNIQKKLPQNIHIIEPSRVSSNIVLSFLHPYAPVILKAHHPKNMPTPFQEVKNANSSSIVTGLNISNHAFVFPGNLEKDDFQLMSKSRRCTPNLFDSDYYAISHHGSLNGHPDILCLGTRSFGNIINCINFRKSRAVLMGRDGAYSGIYDHNTVIPFWRNKLLYTEHDHKGLSIKFLVLDWLTGNVRYRN